MSEEIIKIKNITFTYPGADAPILRDVNLTIKKGEFAAVIGANGCGKSTLCKTLNGIIPHFINGEMSGEVEVCGLDTKENDITALSRRVGYVYQDFENQIIRPTVLDDASYACLNYGMSDYLEKGGKALEKCGLTGREKDFIWQLSGGQTHLLALAGTLSANPDVLILDEPIAQLDPYHADKIYKVLTELNEVHGKTIIVIEHHTEYIARYCSSVILMEKGAPKWVLPPSEALCRVNELMKSDIFPPQVTRAAYEIAEKKGYKPNLPLPVTVEGAKKYFEGLTFVGNKPENSPLAAKPPMVEFKKACAYYRSVKGEPRCVFDELSLTIADGEKAAVIGSNGAGKSTLFKMMTSLVKPVAGEIYIDGEAAHRKSPEKLSGKVSLVYQNPEDMFIKDSIEKDISYAMQARKVDGWQQRTEELIRHFRLDEIRERDGRLLSGGQMRRASLAVGIALKPKVLLLDEPTANLDIATRREVMQTLQSLKGITDTVLIATHDMQLVCQWAQRIIVLANGKIIKDGTRDEVFADREVCRIAGIRAPEIFSLACALDSRARCYTTDDFCQVFDIKEEM